jgi:Zn-dependent protease with chaperone function
MQYHLIIYAAVLVPALVPAVWWSVETHRLLRRPDDPLLPERLLAARRRAAVVLMFSLGIIAGVKTIALWWAVPLALVSRAAAGFRLRRRLYEETWGFGTMVSFATRLIVGVYGFHLTLLALPFIVAAAGAHVWLASAVAAAVLLAWGHWYSPVLRVLLRTAPVSDETLVRAFSDLVERAGVAPPRFEAVNMRGGSLTNAIALPALNGSSVLFTSPLLDRLQTDEIVAIAAHEIAHLEYYSPRRLWQYRLAQWSLILIGAFAFRFWPASLAAWELAFVWFALIIAMLGWRARRRQQNETESDRRAVELTGTPDALARGLTKLNTFARLPRRWDAAFERRATHPSLARRIRDIYAAAGVRPVARDTAEVFVSEATATRVTFGPDELQWARDGAQHHLRYGALSDLRVLARRGDTALLVAADRFGHRWEMPLDAADVGRAQSVLDTVDVHLVANEPLPKISGAARWAAFLAALLALTSGQFGYALVALLTTLAASTRLLAATAVASAAAGAIVLRDGRVERGIGFLAIAAIFGLFTILYRRGVSNPLDRRALAVMGVATALALLLILDNGIGVYRLHQAARAVPDAAVLLLATAAAIRVTARRRATRYAVLLLALAGLGLAFAGASAYVNGFVNDPMLVRAPALEPVHITAAPVATMAVAFAPSDLTLSPDGTRVMLWRDEEDITDQPGNEWTVQIGIVGGDLSRMKVDDAVFLPRGEVLAVAFDAEGAELQKSVAGTEPSWRTRANGIVAGRLTVDGDGRHWTIVGWDGRQQPVKATGTVGTTQVDVARWSGVPGIRYTNIASTGGIATVLEQHYRRSPVSWTLARWGLQLPYESHTRVWRLDGRARTLVVDSELQIACAAAVTPDAFTCAAYDGTRTRISTLAITSGRILPLGIVRGRFTPFVAHTAAGWLSGWRDRSPVAIRLDPLTAYDVPVNQGEYVRSIAGAGDRLAAIKSNGDESASIAVYALPTTVR